MKKRILLIGLILVTAVFAAACAGEQADPGPAPAENGNLTPPPEPTAADPAPPAALTATRASGSRLKTAPFGRPAAGSPPIPLGRRRPSGWKRRGFLRKRTKTPFPLKRTGGR